MNYSIYLAKTITKIYNISTPSTFQKLKSLIGKLFNFYDHLSRSQIYSQFSEILQKYTRISDTTIFDTIRMDDRIKNLTEMISSTPPRVILDIGAGNGDILISLGDIYHISPEKLYAIDHKITYQSKFTVLKYIDEKIPLEDGTVDLIILFSVLHHIPTSSRTILLKEIKRILSPNGKIIIREHAYDSTDHDFKKFIDLTHIFWYIVNNEKEDPLFLMSRKEIQELFLSHNFQSINYHYLEGTNPQKIYHEIYSHQ